MKRNDIRFLHNEWINRPQRHSRCSTSWWVEEAHRQNERQWDFLSRPEFGVTMAYRLAVGGETCRSLKKPQYKWISKAVEFFERYGTPLGGDPELLAVDQAEDLACDPDARIIVQAALLARDSTVEQVAQRLGLRLLTVSAFSDLRYNVIDRRDEPAYIRKAVETELYPPDGIYDARQVDRHAEEFLHAGLDGTLNDVVRLARVWTAQIRSQQSAAVS